MFCPQGALLWRTEGMVSHRKLKFFLIGLSELKWTNPHPPIFPITAQNLFWENVCFFAVIIFCSFCVLRKSPFFKAAAWKIIWVLLNVELVGGGAPCGSDMNMNLKQPDSFKDSRVFSDRSHEKILLQFLLQSDLLLLYRLSLFLLVFFFLLPLFFFFSSFSASCLQPCCFRKSVSSFPVSCFLI